MASSQRTIQYTIPGREDFNKLSDEQKTRVGEAVRPVSIPQIPLFTFTPAIFANSHISCCCATTITSQPTPPPSPPIPVSQSVSQSVANTQPPPPPNTVRPLRLQQRRPPLVRRIPLRPPRPRLRAAQAADLRPADPPRPEARQLAARPGVSARLPALQPPHGAGDRGDADPPARPQGGAPSRVQAVRYRRQGHDHAGRPEEGQQAGGQQHTGCGYHGHD